MRTSFVPALLCLLFMGVQSLHAHNKPLMVEEGTYSVHLLLHTIGTESYTVMETSPNTVSTPRSCIRERG